MTIKKGDTVKVKKYCCYINGGRVGKVIERSSKKKYEDEFLVEFNEYYNNEPHLCYYYLEHHIEKI